MCQGQEIKTLENTIFLRNANGSSRASLTLATASMTAATGRSSVTVDLVAKDMVFSPSTITVPAGAAVAGEFPQPGTPGFLAGHRDCS